MIIKSLLCFCLSIILVLSLAGCAANVNISASEEKEKVEAIENMVAFNGIVKKITIFGSYKEVTVEVKGEEKTFILNNVTHIFDNSYRPRVEPYLEAGTYVKIEVKESELEKAKPTIKYISVESYDGIFAV